MKLKKCNNNNNNINMMVIFLPGTQIIFLSRTQAKRHLTEGMDQPNQEKMRTLGEKEAYKYLEILEADTIRQVKMKEKIKKEYHRKTRKLLATKLRCRNLIKGINSWAVLS